MPAPLGAAPVVDVVWGGRPSITGFVEDDSIATGGPNPMTVQVDINDDGSFEHTVPAFYDSYFNKYRWEFNVDPVPNNHLAFELGFRAVERVGEQTQFSEILHLPVAAYENDTPVVTEAYANNLVVWGTITDSDLIWDAEYLIEVAQGSPNNPWINYGKAGSSGRFYLKTQATPQPGMIHLFIRARQPNQYLELVSNVVEAVYDGSLLPGGPPPGASGPSSGAPAAAPGNMSGYTSDSSASDAEDDELFTFWFTESDDSNLSLFL